MKKSVYLFLFLLALLPVRAEVIRWQVKDFPFPHPARTVARYGDYYYFAYADGIQTAKLDADGHRNPISRLRQFPITNNIYVYDHYLVAEKAMAIAVYDLSDPANPVFQKEIPMDILLMQQDGDRLYTAGREGLKIYSLKHLPDVVCIGHGPCSEDGTPEDYDNFAVQDSILYGLRGSQILSIVDLHDATAPCVLSEMQSGETEYLLDPMIVSGNRIILNTIYDDAQKTRHYFLCTYEVGADWKVTKQSEIELSSPFQRLCLAGRSIVGMDFFTNKAWIFDFPAGSSPCLANVLPLREEEYREDDVLMLNYLFPYLFVFFSDTGTMTLDGNALPNLKILDRTDEMKENQVSFVHGDGNKVATVGSDMNLFLIDGEGKFYRQFNFESSYIFGLNGNALYTHDAGDSFIHLYDTTDPSRPVSLGATSWYATWFRVHGSYGVTVNIEGSNTSLLDLADPLNPQEVLRWQTPNGDCVWDGWLDDNRLFLLSGDSNTVWELDIQNPSTPALTQTIDMGISIDIPTHIAVYRHRFLLVSGYAWINVYDLEAFGGAKLLHQILMPYPGRWHMPPQFQIVDHYLFCAALQAGIYVYDLDLDWASLDHSNYTPAVGHFSTGFNCTSLWVKDDLVYAAAQPHAFSVEYRIIMDGDLDEDGDITKSDADIYRCFLAETPTATFDPAVADLNRDGQCNILDYLLLNVASQSK